jgi:polysaccharide biosynthesis/export protein
MIRSGAFRELLVRRFAVGALALLVSSELVAQETGAVPAPQSPEAVPPAQTVGPQYIIGPGDVLQVFVWRNPELSMSVPVRPDGKISTPLVQDMVAVGKTPTQLARDVEVVLSEYVRSPQVNIIVTDPVSTFSQVKVIGQVVRPQAIPYREGMTLLDLVLQAGGVSQFAAANRTKVVRMENGKHKEIKVKLGDLLQKGDLKHNVMMRPGDVVVIPETRF